MGSANSDGAIHPRGYCAIDKAECLGDAPLNNSKWMKVYRDVLQTCLVGGFTPSEKYESIWIISPRFGEWIKKIFETTYIDVYNIPGACF